MAQLPLSKEDYESNQSLLIDFLRFPLVVGVVFWHTSLTFVCPMDADFSLLSIQGIDNLLHIIFFRFLPGISVPSFALFSGFLFFKNIRKWSWQDYLMKIQKRLKSNIVPYLCWNFLFLSFTILELFLLHLKGSGTLQPINDILDKGIWHIMYDCNKWDDEWNVFGDSLYRTGPICTQLWFLRDLFVAFLLSPIIYFLMKKMGVVPIILLFVAYVTRVWFLLPGFNIRILFYFSLGAFLSLRKINLSAASRKLLPYILPFAIIFGSASLLFYGSKSPQMIVINQLFSFLLIIVVFALVSLLIQKRKKSLPACLSKSSFFIYASHLSPIFIFGSPKGLSFIIILSYVIPYSSIDSLNLTIYLLPLLTTSICLSVYILLSKTVPKLLSPFIGFR